MTFAAISDRTGLSLADLRRDFTCKTDLLRAFQSEVDAEVLAKAKPAGASEQGPRDRVFDIIMTRFEVMAPYKPALRRISNDLCCHPAEAAQIFLRLLRRNIGCLPAPAPSSTVLVLACASRVSRRSTPKCFASGSTIARRD